MLPKCFNIVQRPTFWLSVCVLIFSFFHSDRASSRCQILGIHQVSRSWGWGVGSDSDLRGVMLGGENSVPSSLQWPLLESGWLFFGNGSWLSWVTFRVRHGLTCVPSHGWDGQPGHPRRAPPYPKQDSGNTAPDLPLLWMEVSMDAAWDVGESEDSDFVMVL